MANPPKILIAGLSKKAIDELSHLYSNIQIEKIQSPAQLEDKMDQYCNETYSMAICGDEHGIDFMKSLAQVLKTQGPSLPMLAIAEKLPLSQKAELLKMGYSEFFQWPQDMDKITKALTQELSIENVMSRTFKPIFVGDLDPNIPAPFDTYIHLPLNKKFIRFTLKGEPIGQEKIERLQASDFGRLYIERKDRADFYSYAADKLRKLGGNADGVSNTERQEALINNVREIFYEIFDMAKTVEADGGKELLADAQNIISQYITNGKSSNWYSQLVMTLGSQLENVDHAGTVSTIAALIGIGIQHPNPEDLALAGFFHDVGRTEFDKELLLKNKDEWPKEIWETYLEHPQTSVNLLKQKKILIPTSVERAILQHHERYDGKGFPKQVGGMKLVAEAQLVSFADQLGYLTLPHLGSITMSAKAAFEVISVNGSIGKELIEKVRPLFAEP